MDANKLEVLRDIGYEIMGCGVCDFGLFENPGSQWGTCGLHKYSHLKHTDDRRFLSIHRCGTCPNFQPSEDDLHGFAEFVR